VSFLRKDVQKYYKEKREERTMQSSEVESEHSSKEWGKGKEKRMYKREKQGRGQSPSSLWGGDKAYRAFFRRGGMIS